MDPAPPIGSGQGFIQFKCGGVSWISTFSELTGLADSHCPESSTTEVRRAGTEPGMGYGHHLYPHRRGLAISGRGARPVLTPGDWLVKKLTSYSSPRHLPSLILSPTVHAIKTLLDGHSLVTEKAAVTGLHCGH